METECVKDVYIPNDDAFSIYPVSACIFGHCYKMQTHAILCLLYLITVEEKTNTSFEVNPSSKNFFLTIIKKYRRTIEIYMQFMLFLLHYLYFILSTYICNLDVVMNGLLLIILTAKSFKMIIFLYYRTVLGHWKALGIFYPLVMDD